MNAKVLGLAAIAVMSTLLILQSGSNETDPQEADLLLPGLAAQLETVSRVEISDPEAGWVASAEREGSAWRVPEKAGYAADFETLSRLLRGLAELKIAERKTARPENHAQLGVASAGEGAGIRVQVEAAETFALVIGQSSVARGAFVRRPGEDQVYLANEALDVPDSSMALLDPVIINVEAASVSAVEVRSGASVIMAERDETSGDIKVTNLPYGSELKYATVADSLTRLLINLRMTDVMPHDETGFAEPGRAKVVTSAGDAYIVRSVSRDDGYWVHLDSQPDWQFKVSEYSYNQLNKKLDELLKEEETAADAS